jgi:hypothetical protein
MLFLLIQIHLGSKIKGKNIKPLANSIEPTCTAGSLPTANLVGCNAAYNAVVDQLAGSRRKGNKENSNNNKTHVSNIKEKTDRSKILFKTSLLEDVNLFISKCVKTVCEGTTGGCNSLLNTPIAEGDLADELETDFEGYCAPGADPVPAPAPEDNPPADHGIFTVKVNAFLVLICLTIGKLYLQN